jgi:hypothetical protein
VGSLWVCSCRSGHREVKLASALPLQISNILNLQTGGHPLLLPLTEELTVLWDLKVCDNVHWYKYYVSGHYPSSCFYLNNTTFRIRDSVSVFRREYKQDGILDKNRTMDNVQTHNICPVLYSITRTIFDIVQCVEALVGCSLWHSIWTRLKSTDLLLYSTLLDSELEEIRHLISNSTFLSTCRIKRKYCTSLKRNKIVNTLRLYSNEFWVNLTSDTYKYL